MPLREVNACAETKDLRCTLTTPCVGYGTKPSCPPMLVLVALAMAESDGLQGSQNISSMTPAVF